MKKFICAFALCMAISSVAIAANNQHNYQNRMPFYGNYNNYDGKIIQMYGNKYSNRYGNTPPKDGYGMMPPPQMMYGGMYGQKPPMYGNMPPKDGYGMMPPSQMMHGGMYGQKPPMYGNMPPKDGYGMMPPPQMMHGGMYGQKPPMYGNITPKQSYGVTTLKNINTKNSTKQSK